MGLEGKIALVTGATRGIGKAIAVALVEQGATVIGTATSESGAQSITEYLGANGKGWVLDVSSSESVDAVIKEITAEFGAPTVLVNNAGITRDNLMMRMKEDEWDQVINTNLTSVFRVTKACLRGMTKAKFGRVISISSVVGSMGNGGQTNYSAAKAGLEGFSRSLAAEIASRGITVNCVAPGFIETDMTKVLSEEHKAKLVEKVPSSRLGQPEEIAAAVAFLASNGAAYITGETLHVNGGMYMS
ncbi:MAG: 3-oxoacyl-ACP reductase FabG [Gammaproteobacteria bacterium]|jgi:3-oxoacyl-[acyl-carrier protein] reductase|uniref:3-oxoacyl-[acyl-carrier-protein] reductase n=1 Tax=Marinomonas polaris DSM 16579 TaxID=1122206 RepID=A0A1M4ZX40_9GAMM|nr:MULTISPECIES: 3-oxoacyl-ACP reductase FabG [Marinomonas]MBU1465728.1 3-oxoacyl-ACP reductase FabG [Gammaproteobacteria bacterium]MBU2023732.1 3-oxoacyl-ACP reductase FabG [Gammaproteobacteria bacterium]MBU2319758.1 3-oxoacyl-ACP reductase FabG [Gammaproteobacteria bacterium]MBU2411869.1 3-oxoacyl-ACP reductase FabG [Gammaproteobacteria bacterium]PJE56910.1 3-ketoacyl-ACP reductase [Marinomonas sp. BSi20584]|tara:strand:- start:137153 stop:137887 length:735 start_codon:yes stop_codon:yes gene_type:complete